MAPRFKGPSQNDINKLLRDLEEETFADTDSDFSDIEEIYFNQSLNKDKVTDDFKNNVNHLFEWRQRNKHDKANILTFSGNPGIKNKFSETHLAADFLNYTFIKILNYTFTADFLNYTFTADFFKLYFIIF